MAPVLKKTKEQAYVEKMMQETLEDYRQGRAEVLTKKSDGTYEWIPIKRR